MKKGILQSGADIVFLQEIVGENISHKKTVSDWPRKTQFEFLADTVWPHFSYGKNAITSPGHHGNAVLSKYPIEYSLNIELAGGMFEQRGLLHVKTQQLELYCTHLSLFRSVRKRQAQQIIHYILKTSPPEKPLILAGDFNDWGDDLSPLLKEALGMSEAFTVIRGNLADTFPSLFPFLKLDRVYFRGIQVQSATCLNESPWNKLSDHLPLLVDFQVGFQADF